MSRASIIRVLILAIALGAAGCKSTAKKLSYQGTARKNYYLGVKELIGENFPESLQYFAFIKKKYDRFTPYYVLADLRIADVYFQQEKYTQSISRYKQFISFYPTNPNLAYAMFRIGQSYYKQIPDDWFFLPATWQRDQSNVYDAVRNLRKFKKIYPRSRFVPAANKMILACRKQLYAHENYVLKFYHKRDKHWAVIQRLERIFRFFPDFGKNEEHMFILGESYIKVKKLKKALMVFIAMKKLYPKGKRSGDVQRYISKLTKGT